MKKIIIVFALLLSLLLISCSKEYKITIYDFDGNIYQELSSNDFKKPTMPEVEGYVFIGFKEEIPEKFKSDLELHPIYEAMKHKVKFTYLDGSLFLEVEVNDGDKVSIPTENPTIDNWAFDNWDFDFNTPIKSDTTIRGLFHQVKFSIKFYSGDKLIKEELVEKGATIPMLEDGEYDGVFTVFSIYGKEVSNISSNQEFIGKTSDFLTYDLYDKYNNLVYSGLEYDPIILDYLEKGIEVPYFTFNEWEGTDPGSNGHIKYYAKYTISSETLDKNSSAYWIRENAKIRDVRSIILTLDEIKAINEENIYGAYDKTKVVDITKINTTLSVSSKKSLINSYTNISNNTIYNENGTVNNNTNEILNNRNLNNVDENVRFGLVTDFARLRSYPTNCYSKDREKDMFQETSLNVGEGVAIYHTSSDGLWYFVQAANYAGWVETKNIAICTKEECVNFLTNDDRAVVIANYLNINNHHVRMGQSFPISSKVNETYKIKFPTRKSDGTLEYLDYEINQDNFSIGYLDYTLENILIQGFKIIEMSYSWGDKYETGRDCSSTQNAILSCFGFVMPRNTSNQRSIPEYSQVLSGLSGATLKNNYKPGTLIFSSGHVMLYIGLDENNYPYILHNTTGGGANRCIIQNYESYTNKIIAALSFIK